jgi:hypothetical protein
MPFGGCARHVRWHENLRWIFGGALHYPLVRVSVTFARTFLFRAERTFARASDAAGRLQGDLSVLLRDKVA